MKNGFKLSAGPLQNFVPVPDALKMRARMVMALELLGQAACGAAFELGRGGDVMPLG